MAGMHFLSDEDVSVLKQLINWWSTQSPSRRVRLSGDDEPRLHQAPEVYIALPPLAGIPALAYETAVGTGTHSGTTPYPGDIPGSADCEIYKLINGSIQDAGFIRTVYNLSTQALKYQWFQVQRDKYGNWLAVIGGGGCDTVSAIHKIYTPGRPAGGTFTLNQTINGVTESIVISYNAINAAIKTAYEGHSQIAVNDVVISGGPLPNAVVIVEFVNNLANQDIALPAEDWNSLTGGLGVYVEVTMASKGHS